MRDTHPMQKVYICSEQSFSSTLCLILADLALEVDAMTRFPFQRRCPDRLAQSYDYLCVVLAATARALRCMHALSLAQKFHSCMHALCYCSYATIVRGPLHALAIRGRTSGNFHSCRQCRRGNFVHIAYGNLRFFFFYFSCFRLIFSGI